MIEAGKLTPGPTTGSITTLEVLGCRFEDRRASAAARVACLSCSRCSYCLAVECGGRADDLAGACGQRGTRTACGHVDAACSAASGGRAAGCACTVVGEDEPAHDNQSPCLCWGWLHCKRGSSSFIGMLQCNPWKEGAFCGSCWACSCANGQRYTNNSLQLSCRCGNSSGYTPRHQQGSSYATIAPAGAWHIAVRMASGREHTFLTRTRPHLQLARHRKVL